MIPQVKKLRSFAVLLLATASLAVACQDNRVFPLGDKIVSLLQGRPEVADAIYQYRPRGGEGEAPGMSFTVYLKRSPIVFPQVRPIVEAAAQELWSTPSNIEDVEFSFAPTVPSQPSHTSGANPTGDIVVSMSLPSHTGTVKTSGDQEPQAAADGEMFVADLLNGLQSKYGPHKTS
ncbi:MAG: hypothetical protein ACRC20_09775 [Segniliparus sp.]|uniref:hypothetical protein n=1 Tax=Segniliparus sp. TaxID=2804064 RepID=UPI003F2F99A8